jgi:CubicO group peptidase (beta-lactamase class C family)
MSFGEFLQLKIFSVLNMNSSSINRPRYSHKDIPHLTKGHVTRIMGTSTPVDQFGKNQISYFLDVIVGDGMVNRTAQDLFT